MTNARGVTFDAGTSPFRAKGTLWLGVREFVKERVPGGVDAVEARFSQPLGSFFGQLFLAAGWYDLLPIIDVASAIAATMGVEVKAYVHQTARWQADRDSAGSYAPVLKSETPEAVCKRFATIYGLIYDFGRADVVSEQPHAVGCLAQGMPEPLASWWMAGTEGYLEAVLRAAGARNPRIVWKKTSPDGERAGVRLVKIASSVEWD